MNAPVTMPGLRSEAPLETVARTIFDRLAELGNDGVGITRECYAAGEAAAVALFSEVAEAAGCRVTADAVGNLVLTADDDDGTQPAFYVGSHLDSVPQGGNFDGAAGVVAGLLCLMRFAREGKRPAAPVRVIGFRGEESAFYGRANIGSRVLFGGLRPLDLDAKRAGGGGTLREAMQSVGIDVAPIEAGRTLFDVKQALAYLELHIEQGPVLVARGLPLAIVTGIRGNVRHRKVVCRGEPGHSGAVPRWLRKDAVLAVADLAMRLEEHWSNLLARGLDLVLTIGVLGTNPTEHALSRIPGEVSFSFEIRSQSHETLEVFYELLHSECRAVAAQRGVSFAFDERVDAETAKMNEAIVGQLVEIAQELGLPGETMPSGAGHDAAVFANAGIAAGMIFIRNENGSHNPAEAMDIADFMQGVDLLYNALLKGVR